MTWETTGRTQAPTEVLIPEARAHQRRRYVRSGVALGFCALLAAALIAAAVVLFGPVAGGRTQGSPPAALVAKSAATVYFRPVLCTAPLFNPAAGAAGGAGSPSCSQGSALTTKSLNVQPIVSSPSGFTENNVPTDSALAGVPSTKPSADTASATVLLPALTVKGLPGNGAERYVLGPAEMSSSSIRFAVARRTPQTGQWVVDYTTTTRGAARWDKVARQNFHLLLAVDVGGVVYSAPIIQPTQTSFSSFEGRGEISGNLTKADAQHLASAWSDRK
jgi:hypothetical protein